MSWMLTIALIMMIFKSMEDIAVDIEVFMVTEDKNNWEDFSFRY